MKVTAIKTPLVKLDDDLFEIIKKSVRSISEKSVLVIASKIISFCQGRLIKKTLLDKEKKYALARKEAEFYLEPVFSKYHIILTIKGHTLAVNAGIDESNAAGGYVLWPKDIQKTCNKIWRFLRQHYKIQKVGVVITDSKTIPLRFGVVGTALAHCGFKALHDYRGKKDLFGRKIKMTQINIAEDIAVAAVLEMGEADERTPLCLVESVKKIKFQKRPPTKKELDSLLIDPKDDVYGPLLTSVKWKS